MRDTYEKVAYLKGLTDGMERKSNKNIIKSNELIIEILEDIVSITEDMLDTYENLESYVAYVDKDLELLETQFFNDCDNFDDCIGDDESYDDYYPEFEDENLEEDS